VVRDICIPITDADEGWSGRLMAAPQAIKEGGQLSAVRLKLNGSRRAVYTHPNLRKLRWALAQPRGTPVVIYGVIENGVMRAKIFYSYAGQEG